MGGCKLILGIIIIVGILILTIKIKSSLNNTNTSLGALKYMLTYASDPKNYIENNPRSLNGMDSIYRPLISSDFPDLQVDSLVQKAQNILLAAYKSLDKGLAKSFEKIPNPYFKKSLEFLLEQHKNLGNDAPIFENIHIHRRVLSDYSNRNGRKTIEFQFAVEAMVHSINKPEKVKKQYRNAVTYQFIENTTVFNELDKNKDGIYGRSCSNCGAPMSADSPNYCKYCSTAFKSIVLEDWLPAEIIPEAWTVPWVGKIK